MENLSKRFLKSSVRRLEGKNSEFALKIASVDNSDVDIFRRKLRILETKGRKNDIYELCLKFNFNENSKDILKKYTLEFRDNGEHEKFSNLLELYSDKFNNDPWAQIVSANYLYESGKKTEAESKVKKIIAEKNGSAEVFELLYNLSAKEPDWKKLDILLEGLPSNKENILWKQRLADTAFRLGRWSLAIQYYEECNAKNQKINNFVNLGLAFYNIGNYEKAKQTWDQISKIDKRQVVVDFGSARVLQEKGYWSQAIWLYKEKLENCQINDHRIINAVGFCYAREYKWDLASAYYLRATQLDQNNTKYWYDLGLALERRGKIHEASEAYRKSINNQEIQNYRLYRYIYCLNQVGLVDKAAEYLKSNYYVRKSNVSSLQITKESLKEIRNIALSECDGISLYSVALNSVQINDKVLTESAFQEAIDRVNSHNPDMYIKFSEWLLSIGKFQKGIDIYLESRIFDKPYALNVDDYLKSKAQKDAATYVAFCEKLAVREEVIFYESNHGSSITCSILPLLEAYSRHPDGKNKIHIVVIDSVNKVPLEIRGRKNIVFVSKNSTAYIKYLATAGYLISNNTFPPYFCRRDEQKYLNTWHGTPIKSLGKDIKTGMMDHKNASRNFLHVTHFAVPNKFTGDTLLERYDVSRIFSGKYAVTGSPRMDRSISPKNGVVEEVRKKLNVDPDQKILLYAPTWRGTLGNTGFDVAHLIEDFKALKDSNFKIVFRPHPLMEKQLVGINLGVTTVPVEIDTNDLLAAVDIVVSDYSSIAIDSIGAGKKTILYVYDLKEYQNNRGLYFNLEDLPASIAHSREELKEILNNNVDVNKSNAEIDFWSLEDGRATSRVIDFFFNDVEEYLVEVPKQRKDKEILVFEGHFIPNGVTSSATEFNKYLDSQKIGITLAVEADKIIPFEDRTTIFSNIPESVSYLPHIGALLFTPEEIWLNRMFMLRNMLFSDQQYKILVNAYRREFRRLYGTAEFDNVICFEGYSRYWVNLFAASKCINNKAIYLHSNMVDESEMRFPYLAGVFKMYNYYDKLVSVSPSATLANSAKIPGNIVKEKFVTAENIIDANNIKIQSLEDLDQSFVDFKKSHADGIYVTVGRLTTEKNQKLLIESFSIARKGTQGLVLVGDGPMFAELQVLAHKLGISEHVFFAGYKVNPYPYIAQSDWFVLSSRYEGQGIAILEALALEKPVVSTDIPGPRSILKNGGGILAKPSVESFAEAMVKISHSRETYKYVIEEYIARTHQQVLSILK